mgnify:FL=1
MDEPMGRLESALLSRHKRPRTRKVFALWENLADLVVDLKINAVVALRCMERDMPLPKEFDAKIIARSNAVGKPLWPHDLARMRVQAEMHEELVAQRHRIDCWLDDTGGIEALAEYLGVKKSAARSWRARGFLPPSKKFEIMRYSEERGIELDEALFRSPARIS